ncbi:hypothetical protein BH18ACI2_BH18ACI2_04990 [soil metagenome]
MNNPQQPYQPTNYPQPQSKSNKKLWIILGVLIGIPTILMSGCVACVAILGVIGSQNQPARTSTRNVSTSGSPSGTLSESPKEAALRLIKLDYKWGTGGFGSIMEADFTIQNPSNYTVKDLEITCTHFANSGTKIDSNTRTIYETVPAKGKKVVKDFNMGFIHSQASKSSCEVTDLEVVQ